MKKVLSIVLSIVMVLCMMPAMAFADTATVDFTDNATIQHDVAVDTLAALGIIEGYPDGSFQPAKVVTRAEMAKIIATVLNGGEAPVLSTTTTSYNDTKGHWAAGYIEYCTSLGIVEGFNGAFSPDAPVTAEAAAKMILVAQGYNAIVEGMTGAQWASNTNVLANQNGYYAELKDIDTAAGCSREHVAQMMSNAFAADVITKTNTLNADGTVSSSYRPDTGNTFAEKYLDLDSVEGTLTQVTYADGKYSYTVSGPAIVTEADYTDLFGQTVKVLKNDDKVFGMYADECEVVYEGLAGDIGTTVTKNTIKIDNVDYKVDATSWTTAYAEFNTTPSTTIGAVTPYFKVKAIDLKADGDIDCFTYSPVELAKVDYVGKTQVKYTTTTTNVAVSTTTVAIDLEDIVTYDGIAKNDYVAVATGLVSGKTELTKLEVLEKAVVTSTKGTTAVVDGTTYENLKGVSASTTPINLVILNGYIVDSYGVTATADVTKFAVVTGTKSVVDYVNTNYAKLLMSDGSEKEVVISGSAIDALKGKLVTYTVADGKYEVTAAPTTTTGAAEAYAAVLTGPSFSAAAGTTPAKVSTYAIAADAVVFVEKSVSGTTTYAIMTGAELAKMSTVTVNNAYVSKNAATGYNAVTLAYVTAPASTSSAYAYALDDVVAVTDKDGTTYEVKLSTGDYVATTASAAGIVAGDVVDFTTNSEGKITAIAKVTSAASITAYDGKNVTLDTDRAIADDVTIIYVDSVAKTTADAPESVLAAEAIGGGNETNAIYKVNGEGKVVLLVVDVTKCK